MLFFMSIQFNDETETFEQTVTNIEDQIMLSQTEISINYLKRAAKNSRGKAISSFNQCANQLSQLSESNQRLRAEVVVVEGHKEQYQKAYDKLLEDANKGMEKLGCGRLPGRDSHIKSIVAEVQKWIDRHLIAETEVVNLKEALTSLYQTCSDPATIQSIKTVLFMFRIAIPNIKNRA